MGQRDESAKRSQQDESGGLDPGLMALIFIAQIGFVAWFGPQLWEAYTAGGAQSFWSMTPSFSGVLSAISDLLGGYANPNEHGAAAYAFNWLYTLFLFILLMGFIVAPMHFRQKVNEMAGGGSRD